MLDRAINLILIILILFVPVVIKKSNRAFYLFNYMSNSLGYHSFFRDRDPLVSRFFSSARTAKIENDKYLIDIIAPKYKLNDTVYYEENYIENNDKVIMKEFLKKYEEYIYNLYFSERLFTKVPNRKLKKLKPEEFFMITLYMFFLNNENILYNPDLSNIIGSSDGKVCSKNEIAVVYYKMYYYAATFCYNSIAANNVGVFCNSTDYIEIELTNELIKSIKNRL